MEHITVDIEKLSKVYKAAKKNHLKEVTFEFLVGSCFPDIMNNIKQEMRKQYTLGYSEGLKDKESL